MDNVQTGMPLLGDKMPEFTIQTTHGMKSFPKDYNGKWIVLFSHPGDFTPVCTTELGYMARIKPEFDRRGVKIIGRVSRNGREYTARALQDGAKLYEGVKVNVGHLGPGESRRYEDRIGYLRNVHPKADGLYADFHFNKGHALAEQLVWDAENAPGNVGLSHDAEGRLSRSGRLSRCGRCRGSSRLSGRRGRRGACAERHRGQQHHGDHEVQGAFHGFTLLLVNNWK